MITYPHKVSNEASERGVFGHCSAQFTLILAFLALDCGCTFSSALALPPSGLTSWEIQEVEALVTFVVFDPEDSAVALPKGLSFVLARDVPFPQLEEHLKRHPEHSDWAFSFVEFVRTKGFLLDGKAPELPENGGLGVWFAPVDHSGLAGQMQKDKYDSVLAPSPDALLVLGFWVPDMEYVAHMRDRGHPAEYGMVTIVKDSNGTLHGDMQVGDLKVMATATPHGDANLEPEPFTQAWFTPGEKVESAVILAGGNVRERECNAEWSREGNHPISRGIHLDLTFLVIEGPFTGSAYRLRDAKE